jgi:hypothetical protein
LSTTAGRHSAGPKLLLLFAVAENLRLGWRLRIQRVGDVDHVARQVDQVSALAGIFLTPGQFGQLDGAGAIGESSAGMMIDKAGHGDVFKRCGEKELKD